jgi:hypothetical protein
VIVFRRDDDKPVRANDGVTPFRKLVLYLLPVIIVRQTKIPHVKHLRLDIFASLHLAKDPFRNMLAMTVFAVGAEQDRNEEFSTFHLTVSVFWRYSAPRTLAIVSFFKILPFRFLYSASEICGSRQASRWPTW